ncbi:hypothetical protein DP157_29270 [Klebsiella michiganensis]|nr:hypothetical protein [Klebsiella michiganensis]
MRRNIILTHHQIIKVIQRTMNIKIIVHKVKLQNHNQNQNQNKRMKTKLITAIRKTNKVLSTIPIEII